MSNATVILAGGMSRRFGADKPFLLLHGEPLLTHAIERAFRFSDEIVVSIGHQDSANRYEQFLSDRVRIVKDNCSLRSPLVGILTGLRSLNTDYAMVLPCDLPFVNRHVASLLLERILEHNAAVPRWSNGNIEPLHSVYRVAEAKLVVQKVLLLGHLRVAEMIDRLRNVIYVDVDELRTFDKNLLTFFNVNTRQDLEKAERIFNIALNSN